MALVTVRILDGPDRGKEFYQMATPVTIGREEGNLIQLNDHRVSRYHLKIHENDNTVLLTDLQSTNGTKINGEPVRAWLLQPGDLITLGQTILLFGSATEIAERLAMLNKSDLSAAVHMGTGSEELDVLSRMMGHGTSDWTQSSQLLAREIFGNLEAADMLTLQTLPPPSPPSGLSPQQSAQMEAFLQYLHLRLRYLVTTVRTTPAPPGGTPTNAKITISAQQWQNIVDLHARIATYMSAPTSENEA
jgi:pSer/pThr/pTyr-binding forkhead associated (FHA) protein